MFKFRKDHPYRPVNWRWERARVVKEYGKLTPGRNRDDHWTRIAVKFRAAKDRCKTEADLYRLFDTWPDLAMAYELWDEEGFNIGRSNAMRYEIEARLLAGESFESIAKRSGLSQNVLKYYERLFFNVTDRLDNKMYIFHVAIGDTLHRGMTDRDYAVIWKLYAYVRGSTMLDFLISTFNDWTKPTKGQIETTLLEDHKLNMRRKAALASRMSSINQHTADRLIELHTKITEIEKAAGEASQDAIHNNIQVMLNNLPMLVGQQPETPILGSTHQISDLRASEVLALSTNQADQVDLNELNEFKFPEPNNAEETNQRS